MKQGFFTLLFTALVTLGYSQITYYWVGGVGGPAPLSTPNFTDGVNWNTNLDGSGTARTTQLTTDILIVDGSNIGGTTPTTGPIESPFTGTPTIGKLQLQNGADLALRRPSAGGTTTVTIGDDPSGDDLVIFAGCTLRIKGTTGSLLIVLLNNATANNASPATTSATAYIQGDIIMEEGNNTYQNRFTSRLKGAFVFASGSRLITRAAYNYYAFGSAGSSVRPIADGVIFEDGASYIHEGGLSATAFGSSSTATHVNFKPGSNFYFRAPAPSNMFSNRKYGNVFIENNTTVTANGSIIKMENLTIAAGSSFITDSSGTTSINGNIVNNGTLIVPATNPYRSNKIVMINSLPQTIDGSGSFSLGNFYISNESNVTMNKSIMVDTATLIIGALNLNGNNLTGAGTTTVKPMASVPANGNLNVDSFIVKNIADFTGIVVGMSVTGTGVPANTVVTNMSTAAGTITLSKAVTGTVLYGNPAVALTIFNNLGVLPLDFGRITATMQKNATQIDWLISNEVNTNHYIVQRNTADNQFSEIGKVNANKLSKYTFTDASPASGKNLYRIVGVDNDGKRKYSTIVQVNFTNTNLKIEIYPNPVTSVLGIKGLNSQSSIRIMDVNGRPVLQTKSLENYNTMNINVSGLVNGKYILEVSNKDGKQTKSFIKM